jgi:hypothetical protein
MRLTLLCQPSDVTQGTVAFRRSEKGDFNKKSKFLNVHQRKNLR